MNIYIKIGILIALYALLIWYWRREVKAMRKWFENLEER